MAKNQRSNPNEPLSEQQEKNQAAQQALDEASGKDTTGLPDDPDELKIMLLEEKQTNESLEIEKAQLEQKISGLERAAKQVEVLQAQVEKSIADTDSKFRPLLGYHDEKYGVECIAAPLSDKDQGAIPMLVIPVLDGKPVTGFRIDTLKVVLKPEGYRISGHTLARG